MKVLGLLIVLLVHKAFGAPVGEFSVSEIMTYVSPGAEIVEMPGVHVYADEMDIFFLLPDMPHLPSPSKIYCPPDKPNWCQIPSQNNDILLATFEALKSFQNVFTTGGVSITKSLVPYPPNSKIELTEADKTLKSSIERAGSDWYQYAKSSIEDRTLDLQKRRQSRDISLNAQPVDMDYPAMEHVENVSGNTSLSREVRVAPIIAKALPVLAKTLWVNKGQILSMLTKLRAYLPRSLKTFSNLPMYISEFTLKEKESNTAIANVRGPFFKKWQILANNPRAFPDTGSQLQILDSLYKTEEVQQNAAVLIHYTVLLNAHSSAFITCRDGRIPLLFAPPALLRKRLEELEASLGPDQEMLISSDACEAMYSMDIATCRFDNDGGILTIKTFLKPKLAKYRLYQFQSLAFAWYNYTCDLGIPSLYVIKDEESGMVYPVSNLDEETCQPIKTSYCKLPQAANAEIPQHYCLNAMLQGGSTSEIEKACPLSCREGTRLTSSQINQDMVAFAHLPQQGAKVVCENGTTFDVNHEVVIGAVRISLGCGCKVLLKGKIIGKSKRFNCDDVIPYRIDHLLPIQITLLDDFSPEVAHLQTAKEIRFRNPDAILNEDWIPEQMRKENEQEETVTWKLPAWSLILNCIQWMFLFVLFYKYKMGPFAFLAPIDPVQAAKIPLACELPQNVYVYLYIVIGLLVVGLLPGWLIYIYSKCKKTVNRAIENRAAKRIVCKPVAYDP